MASATADRETKGMGEISTEKVYPLPLFMRLTGLSDWAMRQARRRGLKLRTCGRRKFVRGADWHEHLGSDAS
jgi:hypothetical protein